MMIFLMIFLTSWNFEKYLEDYYFPKEKFYTYEEERNFVSKFLEEIIDKDFSISDIKFVKKLKMKKEELYGPHRFCSRLHLMFLGCHINIWSYMPKTDTKYDIHLRFCGWPAEHFCYFEVDNINYEDDYEEINEFFLFKKKFKLCDERIKFCYNIRANFYILNENIWNKPTEKLENIKFHIYRIEELAFYNNRIIKFYGKIIKD